MDQGGDKGLRRDAWKSILESEPSKPVELDMRIEVKWNQRRILSFGPEQLVNGGAIYCDSEAWRRSSLRVETMNSALDVLSLRRLLTCPRDISIASLIILWPLHPGLEAPQVQGLPNPGHTFNHLDTLSAEKIKVPYPICNSKQKQHKHEKPKMTCCCN